MSEIKRREARELVIALLFETEFKDGESVSEIYELSAENREIPEDEYIKRAYFGVCENREKIDDLIGSKHRIAAVEPDNGSTHHHCGSQTKTDGFHGNGVVIGQIPENRHTLVIKDWVQNRHAQQNGQQVSHLPHHSLFALQIKQIRTTAQQ